MHERLFELIKQADKKCGSTKKCEDCSAVDKGDEPDDCVRYNIADHLLANGVIVPPCKAGDTVYTILRGEIFCYTVLEYGVRGKGDFVYAENDRNFLDFPFAELGKTVFFTREEAEQALKGETHG
jgi:hypothetical protein